MRVIRVIGINPFSQSDFKVEMVNTVVASGKIFFYRGAEGAQRKIPDRRSAQGRGAGVPPIDLASGLFDNFIFTGAHLAGRHVLIGRLCGNSHRQGRWLINRAQQPKSHRGCLNNPADR